ncbi:MAG TPA: hypothetical protein VL970_04630 [Candidatus Acidoferrales bacterium]|nr:hypothetical protein [Candidatus Acidoferrales bacterium]
MKTLLVTFFALAAICRASGQVKLELVLDQNQFLPDEAVRLAVKITNTSGERLYLGDDPNWLTFSVDSQDDFLVFKNSDVPVVEPFDLESSQMGTKYVNLQPYFQMDRIGRYKVTATMRIKQWSLTVNSAPVFLDVVHGAQLWSQDFGLVVSSNLPPEPRKYTLIKANYLRAQLRLYVQVSSGDESRIYKVAALGPMLSFSAPEEQVDQSSRLHILWQTGGQSFNYVVVNADGATVSREVYDNFNSRPRLSVTTDGDVVVRGGVRRLKPEEVPLVKLPATDPASAPAPRP